MHIGLFSFFLGSSTSAPEMSCLQIQQSILDNLMQSSGHFPSENQVTPSVGMQGTSQFSNLHEMAPPDQIKQAFNLPQQSTIHPPGILSRLAGNDLSTGQQFNPAIPSSDYVEDISLNVFKAANQLSQLFQSQDSIPSQIPHITGEIYSSPMAVPVPKPNLLGQPFPVCSQPVPVGNQPVPVDSQPVPVGQPIPAGLLQNENQSTINVSQQSAMLPFESKLPVVSEQSTATPADSQLQGSVNESQVGPGFPSSAKGPGVNPFIHSDTANWLPSTNQQSSMCPPLPVISKHVEAGTVVGTVVPASTHLEITDRGGSVCFQTPMPNSSSANVINKKDEVKKVNTVDRNESSQAVGDSHIDIIGNSMFLRNLPTGGVDIGKDQTNPDVWNDITCQLNKALPVPPQASFLSDLTPGSIQKKYYPQTLRKPNPDLKKIRGVLIGRESLYRCSVCGAEFFFRGDLIDHHKTVHIPFYTERIKTSQLAAEWATRRGNHTHTSSPVAAQDVGPDMNKQNDSSSGARLCFDNKEQKADDFKQSQGIKTITPSATVDSRTEHSNSDTLCKWFCAMCTGVFHFETEFEKHMKEAHNDKIENSSKQCQDSLSLIRCDICGGEFMFEEDLKDHQETVHDTLDDGPEDDTSSVYLQSTCQNIFSLQEATCREFSPYRGKQPGRPLGRRAGSSNVGTIHARGRGSSRGRGNCFTRGRAGGSSTCSASRRGRGRRGRGNISNNQQVTNETPYESNDSDIEIVEQPKVVIEINDLDDSPDEVHEDDPRKELSVTQRDQHTYLNFYCGLCAITCKSSEALDAHMESHNLNNEISNENKKSNERRNIEILGDRYVSVVLERLPDTVLLGPDYVKTASSHCSAKDNIKSVSQGQGEPLQSGLHNTKSPSSLANGIRTMAFNARNYTPSLTQGDKNLLDRYNMKESAVVLGELEVSNIMAKVTEKENSNWLDRFSCDDVDEHSSDIEWDLPGSPCNIDDGYEADDNSDIVPCHKPEKLLQTTSKDIKATDSYISDNMLERKNIRNSMVLASDKNDKYKSGIPNLRKRCARSDNAHMGVKKIKTLQKETAACNAVGITLDVLERFKIYESCIILNDVIKDKSVSKRNIKIKDSARKETDINISTTSWWKKRHIEEKIDFNKAPIVSLRKIDSVQTGGSKAMSMLASGFNSIRYGADAKPRFCKKQNSKRVFCPQKKNTNKKDFSKFKKIKNGNFKSVTIPSRGIVKKCSGFNKPFYTRRMNKMKPEKPLKQSLRIMDLETGTRRKALEHAISLIKKKPAKKAVNKRIENDSSESKQFLRPCQTSPLTRLPDCQLAVRRNKRKGVPGIVGVKDCEIKMPRLKDSDVLNWKEKELKSKEKLRNQMTKLLSPEKTNLKVALEKLSPKNIKKYSEEGIAVCEEVKQNLFGGKYSETGSQNDVDVQVQYLMNEIICKVSENCDNSSTEETIKAAGDIVDELIERVCRKSDKLKMYVSTQVAKDIVNEIIDKVCTANDQINVSKHIASDLGDVSQKVASG